MQVEPCGLAISRAGRDRDQLFLVLAREGRTVLLADGRSRKLDKPKRKNIRHVTFLPDSAFAAVRAGMKDHLTDAAVRRALACCRPGVSTEMGGT